jgi:hypothetical protein
LSLDADELAETGFCGGQRMVAGRFFEWAPTKRDRQFQAAGAVMRMAAEEFGGLPACGGNRI